MTPKVDPTAEKPSTGRARKRKIYNKKQANPSAKLTPNSHDRIHKQSPTALDAEDKMVPLSRSEMKRGNDVPVWESKIENRFHMRSHHQERGKQWARDVNSVGRKEKEEETQALVDRPDEPEASEYHSSQIALDDTERQQEHSDECEDYDEYDEEYSDDEYEYEDDLADELLKDKPFLVVAKSNKKNNTTKASNTHSNGDIAIEADCAEDEDGECEICNARKYDRDTLGFDLQEEYLTEEELVALMKLVEEGTWANDKEQKRVQIFGYNYLEPTLPSVPIPSSYSFLVDKLEKDCYGKFDQLIISEYLPGVGVAAHVDRFFWDERVVGVSVIGTCNLRLLPLDEKSADEVKNYELQAGSLYCLSGKSRYEYSHSIDGQSVTERRISFTFRTLAKDKVLVLESTVQALDIV